MAARKRKTEKAVLRDSADVLADVEAIEVRLENGETVSFNMADELHIPAEAGALAKAARKTAAQVAFWNYQTERALKRVRSAEIKLARDEGKQWLVYRKYHMEEECETPAQGTLRARVDYDRSLWTFRVALQARRKEYGVVRSMRDAVNHRSNMVRTLIGKYEPT